MAGDIDHESPPPPLDDVSLALKIAALATDIEDVLRKRKASPASDIADESRSKRQRGELANGEATLPPRASSFDTYLPALPVRSTSLPPNMAPMELPPPYVERPIINPGQTTPFPLLLGLQPTHHSPTSHEHVYVAPPRENLQFTATDLPRDDDSMMRWLAHRVRDSATTHNIAMSMESEHSPDHGGGESDPESRAERERVRAENRERKKKWREENSDRNKDNDLRGRVSRRANKIFGPGNSEEKRQWIASEFDKRKSKREFKTQLKKNETPGSLCWNANDDFSDHPSQVMAGVLTNQEGAAENFRNWLETGDVDIETWMAACQKIWGDPELREYLETLAPENDGETSANGQGGKADGKGADDGLTSKFDAAFDAIIGRPASKPTVVPTPIQQQAAETPEIDMTAAETTPPNESGSAENAENEAAVSDEADAATAEAGGSAEAFDQLTEEDLKRLIDSGEMSMEDIAALEAALGDETYGQGTDLPEPQAETGASSAEQTDIALPDLHSDHTDISDLHLQLEMMSPSTRDTFLSTIIGHPAIDEMKLDETAAVESTEQADSTEETATADAAGEDGSVLDLLASAGINLDDLDEEQLQKFINAVSGDGDMDEVITGIQAQQEAAAQAAAAAADSDKATAPTAQQTSQATMTDDNMDLNDEDDGNYGEDFDDSDEIDLTPDIMRIILERSDYSSLLGGQSLDSLTTSDNSAGGDAHTIQPTPSAPMPPPPPPSRTPARQTYPMIQQQRQQQLQQQHGQQYNYVTGRYGNHYTYSYQRPTDVPILPPGYSAHQRPPVMPQQQQAPRYPDLTYLLKPLAYKPAKVAPHTPVVTATTPTTPAGENDSALVNGVVGAGQSARAAIRNALSELRQFELPIPSFMNRTPSVVDIERKREEERNVRAMGFPPMAGGLKL